jgi:ankyrin repeat protein
MSVLMWGVLGGNTECVSLLLELGGDITQCEAVFQENSLHLACRKGNTEVVRLLINHHTKQQKKQPLPLQDEKNPFYQRNVEGCTPLHLAAAAGHTAVVQVCH